jgi:hypothetical protein
MQVAFRELPRLKLRTHEDRRGRGPPPGKIATKPIEGRDTGLDVGGAERARNRPGRIDEGALRVDDDEDGLSRLTASAAWWP